MSRLNLATGHLRKPDLSVFYIPDGSDLPFYSFATGLIQRQIWKNNFEPTRLNYRKKLWWFLVDKNAISNFICFNLILKEEWLTFIQCLVYAQSITPFSHSLFLSLLSSFFTMYFLSYCIIWHSYSFLS